MANDKNKRLGIPEKVRAHLWVAAAGHCQYNGCNKPLDRNILTQAKVFLGQHAHIIGDSIHGPRGDVELSKRLSQDASNILLVCAPCHLTIDKLADDYPVDLLRRMKKRHEERVQKLYDLDASKDSVAVVLLHPIKRIHVPQFSDTDVQRAILENSDFSHRPGGQLIELDYRTRASRESDATYWSELVKEMTDGFQRQLHYVASGGAQPGHLSICAFGPMPILMQLGALVGNKVEVSTFQWDRIGESWNFRKERMIERQVINYSQVPSGGGEIALIVSMSGEVDRIAVEAVVPGMQVVRFGVPAPTPHLVEDAEDVLHFRTQFTALMAEIRNKGYKRIHVFPAMPLSHSVEFGRQLLPKVDPEIEVWDFNDGAFNRMLTLQV